jgi:hypothetical protein
MLKVMDSINNHFIRSIEYVNTDIDATGINGSFNETYLAGMYVIIKNSYLNDGVYKISAVSDTKLTVEETLIVENTVDQIAVIASTPQQDFIDLAADIESFKNSVDYSPGLTSESLGDHSESYVTDGSWKGVYSKELNNYRKVFDDLKDFMANNLNWQDRA